MKVTLKVIILIKAALAALAALAAYLKIFSLQYLLRRFQTNLYHQLIFHPQVSLWLIINLWIKNTLDDLIKINEELTKLIGQYEAGKVTEAEVQRKIAALAGGISSAAGPGRCSWLIPLQGGNR